MNELVKPNRLPYTRWIQITNRAVVPLEEVVLEIDTFGIGRIRRVEVGTIAPYTRTELSFLRRHEKVDGVRLKFRVGGGPATETEWKRTQGLSYFRWICLYLTELGELSTSHRKQEVL